MTDKIPTYNPTANYIGQAHLLPGMNLLKWREIIAPYSCQSFGDLSAPELAELITKIKEIINAPRI